MFLLAQLLYLSRRWSSVGLVPSVVFCRSRRLCICSGVYLFSLLQMRTIRLREGQ